MQAISLTGNPLEEEGTMAFGAMLRWVGGVGCDCTAGSSPADPVTILLPTGHP
jgi:hypothetical protein